MPVLVYSLLRILLIVAAGGGLYLAGLRGWLLVVVAVLVGAGLSYVLLDKQRRASAEWLAARGRGHTRFEDRLAADAGAEDALLDEDAADAAERPRPAQEATTADADRAEPQQPARRGEAEPKKRSDRQDDQDAEPHDQL